ncbi:MAG TPA: hypothetical protein VHZ76_05765 [Gammaproteobacteria bacterium]|jgi:hypothetical protein|nr:hypothetical protein [Gammaproteobacteria bacterium]
MTDQTEEKLIIFFKTASKLERAKRIRAIKSMMILLVLVMCIYGLCNYVSFFNETITYTPDSTIIDLPDRTLTIGSLLLGAFCFYVYMVLRNPIILFALPLLVFALKYSANPLKHFYYEIWPKQYHNVKTILADKPELISILPNYVNAKCEMTTVNYKKFTALAEDSNPAPFLADFPLKKVAVADVNKMCARMFIISQ